MADIQSILNEQRVFPPSSQFSSNARIPSRDALSALSQRAEADPDAFWAEQAHDLVSWERPFKQVLDSSAAPHYRWFADGTLNVSYNCLDRHLPRLRDKVAVHFEGERDGDRRSLTYGALHEQVCRFANGLRSLGLVQGDRVVILLPHVPEALVAMQACARLGLIHSVVFGGFSAESLKDRIEDAGARVLITADGGFRGGKVVELKHTADKALALGCKSIEKVVVLQRTGTNKDLQPGRDVRWDDLVKDVDAHCPPVWVDSEHPLFLLYTSGSTGKPKGIVHSSGGYLLGALCTMRWVFDLQDKDVYWCTADVGWITGHTYVNYGPLAAGATQVMYEGGPTTPHNGRFWEICQRYAVSIFYTAPTAIRALMRFGDEVPKGYDLSALRLLGSVGEPINPEAWMWYHTVVGGERCPIVDTWWQTETGAIMMAPVPGAVPTKPGSCTLPLPGVAAAIVDEQGAPVTAVGQGGFLVMTRPWPSMLRTIWNDDARYVQTYWQRFANRFYVAGDGAHRDADGYFWILGRIDDVLNVSGHRLGTMEIESALGAHPKVAESAVVGKPDEIKGESVFAYVVLKGGRPSSSEAEAVIKELRAWVGEQIGALAKPDTIRLCDGLPKTRSGKIMRRLLRSIARGEPITDDISTLENEGIVAQLRGE